jgi:hypothetical protein
MKARSDLMCFWKLLSDCEFTGSPSSLTEDQVRAMAEAKGMLSHEIEKVIQGLKEFQNGERQA